MKGAAGPRPDPYWSNKTHSKKWYDSMMSPEEVKAEVDYQEAAVADMYETRPDLRSTTEPKSVEYVPPPPPKKKGRWEDAWRYGDETHSEPRKGLKGFLMGKGHKQQKWVEDEEGYYQGSEEDMAARKLRQTLQEIVRQVISENNE